MMLLDRLTLVGTALVGGFAIWLNFPYLLGVVLGSSLIMVSVFLLIGKAKVW